MPLYTRLPAAEKLGFTKMATAGPTSAVVTIPAREMLLIQINVTGYSSSDIVSLRFNGDTGSNYNSNYISASTATPAAPTSVLTTNMLRCGQNAVTQARQVLCQVQNFASTQHPVVVQSLTQSATGTAPVISVGGGNWNSASAVQITTVQLLMPGSANFTVGTSMVIYGADPF